MAVLLSDETNIGQILRERRRRERAKARARAAKQLVTDFLLVAAILALVVFAAGR